MKELPRIAILDDYQHVAMKMADWSHLKGKADITVFHDHVADENDVVKRLLPFNAVCVMRERTPLPHSVLSQLPNLKLVVSTGQRNASIDMQAAADLGITVTPTGYHSSGAPELTWTLLLAAARNIVSEHAAMRNGEWQQKIGIDIQGKTIGIVGLGKIGSRIASYALSFGMKVIAWSENLTAETAEKYGATLVSKEELFRRADFISVHLVLSSRSREIVTATDLALMKPTAWFINTSRGPLVDETALVSALEARSIAGAALDTFDQEPLPPGHRLRGLDNALLTPHLGYVTEDQYQVFYRCTVENIQAFLDGAPIRALRDVH